MQGSLLLPNSSDFGCISSATFSIKKSASERIFDSFLSSDCYLPKNPLKNHMISTGRRSRMIDWMIEVMNKCRASNSALFLAVNLLDRFLESSKKPIEKKEFHLSGIVAMSLASKFTDVRHLTLKFMKREVGHGCFTIKQLSNMEREMLITLKFDLKVTLPHDILLFLCEAIVP